MVLLTVAFFLLFIPSAPSYIFIKLTEWFRKRSSKCS